MTNQNEEYMTISFDLNGKTSSQFDMKKSIIQSIKLIDETTGAVLCRYDKRTEGEQILEDVLNVMNQQQELFKDLLKYHETKNRLYYTYKDNGKDIFTVVNFNGGKKQTVINLSIKENKLVHRLRFYNAIDERYKPITDKYGYKHMGELIDRAKNINHSLNRMERIKSGRENRIPNFKAFSKEKQMQLLMKL